MNAVLHSSRFEPKPLRHGFAVDSTWFKSFKHCDYAAYRASYPTVPAINMARYFKPVKPMPRSGSNSSPKRERNTTAGVSAIGSSDAHGLDIVRMQFYDVGVDTTLDISISTIDTLGPETPPTTPHNLLVKSQTPHSLVTSDISKELVILPSTMAPHRVLGTCHTRSVLFELDEAQVPLSASNGFSCDGIATVDKEVMAAKGKENVATQAVAG